MAIRFSVVVPLYNKARYVREALASIRAQTVEDVEIVVVDDGSTDGSPGIVEALGDERIRLVRQPNGGVAKARNRGIAEARGEWISFLDADDWLHPEFLQRMGALIERHPEARFVACAIRPIPDGPDWRPGVPPVPEGRRVEMIDDLPSRLGALMIHIDTSMFRSDLLREMSPCFAEDFCQSEDIDLILRAAERSSLAYLPAELACYRTGVANSLMSRSQARDLLRFLQRLERRVSEGDVPERLRASSLRYSATARVAVARAALADGDRRGALRHLAHAWRAMDVPSWWYTFAMFGGAPAEPARRLRGVFGRAR